MYRTRLLGILALAAAAYACGGKKEGPEDEAQPTADGSRIDTSFAVREVVGIARIEPPGKIITLQAESSGFVQEVLFSENQSVQKGDVLLRLDAVLEQAQVQQAQSRIQTQQTAIEAAQANTSPLQIKLSAARNTYQRELKLLQGNAGTQQAVDDSRYQVEELEKQVAAQQALVAQQRALLEELRSALAYNQAQAGKKTLRAPLTGTFLSCEVKPGNYLNTASPLGEFAVEGPYIAVTEVDELYALRVKEGMSAFIRPQGGREVLSKGKVVFVGPYLKKKSLFSDRADNLEDRRVREIRVQLDNSTSVLIGSRVECVIALDQ